jgi:hypothetical protein
MLMLIVFLLDKNCEFFFIFLGLPFVMLAAACVSFCLYWILNYAVFYTVLLIAAPFYYLFFYSWAYFEFG